MPRVWETKVHGPGRQLKPHWSPVATVALSSFNGAFITIFSLLPYRLNTTVKRGRNQVFSVTMHKTVFYEPPQHIAPKFRGRESKPWAEKVAQLGKYLAL